MIKDIPEKDFTNQIEIIGWLYQYYNSELKDDTFKNIKKNKVPKNRIPAATQLFTPDWIVKYMVENSLGRLWLEGHPNIDFKSKMKYYLEECEQENDVDIELNNIRENLKNINPEDISVIDPCMGSGHILTYVFDILMEIYISMGYTKNDSTIKILENNIYGLDIDNRAYQLAYFSIMMKAREYNRKILKENISPLLYPIQESDNISMDLINSIIKENPVIKEDLLYLIDIFKNAKEYGSLINVKNLKFNEIKDAINHFASNKLNFIYKQEIIILANILNQAILLNKKYDVVITNPPYMGSSGMTISLKKYLKKEYPDSQRDLFATFIEKCLDMVKDNYFASLVTMQSWMFLSSFEKLRMKLLKNNFISNLLHMDNMVMGIAFGTSATIFRKTNMQKYKGFYTKVKYEDLAEEEKVPYEFPVPNNYQNYISSESFSKIPGNPIAYWVNKNIIEIFNNTKKLGEIASAKCGLKTGDTQKYIKKWYEVNFKDIGFNYTDRKSSKTSGYKWFPATNGGSYRKWYGNFEDVVYWYNDGDEIRNLYNSNGKLKSRPQNMNFYFKNGLTWSALTSKKLSVRITPIGHIITGAGYGIFNEKINLYTLLGFLNSKVAIYLTKIFSETLNFEVGTIEKLPIVNYDIPQINEYVLENIKISFENWNTHEISYYFKKHSFIKTKSSKIEESINILQDEYEILFEKIKNNEESINKIFINLYKLDNTLDYWIESKDITLFKPNIVANIKSFVSYFMGCLFGRYSLDKEGLISAGTFNIQNYKKYIPDEDNIVPILDNDYFEDDIVNRFEEFLKTCFGTEYHEENLEFIAKALKKKGNTSREIIRNYFLNDFFKDHTKTYQKRPIYWQFDSGKQNGFKCLIYMHRYTPDTLARIRTEYLHKTQKAYETQLEQQKNLLNNTATSKDKTRINKEIKKLTKQIQEIQKYDETLATLADKNIQIDLDDGVKHNYQKFKLGSTNILKKI